MYERGTSVPLKSSASLFPNNLCRVRVNGTMYAGVAHKDEMNIVCPITSRDEPGRVVVAKMTSSAPSGATIMQAAWVEVHRRPFLVLATTKGVLLFDWDGSVLRHAHLLPTPPLESPFSFTKGIASLYTGYICVGIYTGEVLMFSVTDNGDVLGTEKVTLHPCPINALASLGQVLVSGDDEGGIVVSQEEEGSLSKICSIESYESPVTCIAVWSGQVLAAFLSGHLRLFNLQGQILAEVCAHACSITGLDVAQETGLAISVSEDTFVRIWQLHLSSPELPIEHKYSASEENAALCGGVFTDDLGSGYVLASYDSKELICYAM
ncbi:WD repeat-containing protein 54-like isoform X1 [Eriocheir sinensis]|uniref:WD repeat-containing protein 54-like isoform X1 n=1 Tax=Eriocheir sinensis TaxID=95602 RepID=UPI0021C8C4E3|nr:WD repeat-containing protein 54-like isoform X1 [Eriocheir sinensis]XP_050718565.1 WD repeat-containing protein 54-like isoform X1 [Eriocheir sinensis]XP_050718566.1 WD repeat-containing protein 54-like isoform X1 [Eriocheir sinensis]